MLDITALEAEAHIILTIGDTPRATAEFVPSHRRVFHIQMRIVSAMSAFEFSWLFSLCTFCFSFVQLWRVTTASHGDFTCISLPTSAV